MPRRQVPTPASRYQRQLHYGNATTKLLSGLRVEREKAANERSLAASHSAPTLRESASSEIAPVGAEYERRGLWNVADKTKLRELRLHTQAERYLLKLEAERREEAANASHVNAPEGWVAGSWVDGDGDRTRQARAFAQTNGAHAL